MEVVKQFNTELSALYESKPPISKAKMTSITRTAIKAIKLYKHVVQSVEKFIQKCKPEYKVPGLYVIDSIVRQSRHQFGTDKDVFAPRFARNLQQTFIHLFSCPPEDKSKVIRVLNLWQKNAVFESDVIQPLFDLADPNHPIHKEQAALAPSNGIAPVKPPAAMPPKTAAARKEGGTANWINQLPAEPNQPKPHVSSQGVDVNIIQQLQQLQTLLLDQQSEKAQNKDSDQVKFDKKLLDFDYGEEEDEDGQGHHQQQQQVVASLDSLGSILSNPEVLRQLQTLQQTLSNPQQARQQQLDMEEKMRKMQEMRQQEEEFDKHLAQTVPNLPFADECELKPGVDLNFPGMDLSQPPPGYLPQQKLVVPAGMMMKPPPSPLEDGERANSDADERMGRDDEGPSVVVLDSDSPSSSPARSRRRRRRSRSRSHRRSRSDSRSRSYNKRKRSSSYDDRDWEKMKLREAEKEKERERKRKGLPILKSNHLAVCSTTLWIGHLSKLVQQEELSDTFGEFGDIVSIDLIPPRGCAFICMNRRQDAYRALQDLKHHKLQGKAITLAWAPGKGMKGKEYKDYWEVEQGVSYIPWSKISRDVDLELLEEGGMIDEESFPEWLKERQRKTKDEEAQRSQSSSQAEDDDMSRSGELDIPVPAPTLPGFIPLPDGPQPDHKVNQPPPNMPPMMAAGPPLSMMPPFVPRLLGPMGMAMGPGLMPNVPLGVPPPGLMGNPLMHQQMMGRMPQPVGSPFNPPPGVGILGGHPQLSQIPLPGSQDKGKGLAGEVPTFSDPLLQIPFTLPPQLQMPPGMSLMTRAPMNEKSIDDSNESDSKISSPSRNDVLMAINAQFGQPPPQFSPMSLMKIPPPMSIPPPSKSEYNAEDKDERENKDKDYRDNLKDYKDRDKERDRDYRNKRDRDYRGDRDYRDRYDKDYRERDKDYRDKDRKDRRERSRERDNNDKSEDIKEKEGEKDRKDDTLKDRSDRDKGRSRDRDRDRGRDRKWGDRGRERDRDEKRGRDREQERNKELKGSGERDKGGANVQERLRSLAHDQDRSGEFSRGGMDPDGFQEPGGPQFGQRNEGFRQDNFQPDMHGHPGSRHDGFNNRGPRDMFDHRGPPPDGFGPRDNFGPRGPPPDGFGSRGPLPDGFGPRGPPPGGFGLRGPPPDGFKPRGPLPEDFDHRGPPGFVPSDNFDPRASHPDFDGPDSFGPRGSSESFNRGLLPDNFGPGSIPPDGFPHRGPPNDDFGPPPFDGFGGPPGDFQPRIRIEFFNRGRGRGLQDFRGRGIRGGPIFSPRGNPRGPRPGSWMESQNLSPPKSGFGFSPRGFTPPEGMTERFGPPGFEDGVRGHENQANRGRERDFPGHPDEHRREEDEARAPSPKRSSRWSNMSPPLQSEEEMHKADEATAEAIMAEVQARENQESEGVSQDTPECSSNLLNTNNNSSSCIEQSVSTAATSLEPLRSKNSEEDQHINEPTSNVSATNIDNTLDSISEHVKIVNECTYPLISESEEREPEVQTSLPTHQQSTDTERFIGSTSITISEKCGQLEQGNDSEPQSSTKVTKPTPEVDIMFDNMEVEQPHSKDKSSFDDTTQNSDTPNPFDTMAHLPNVDELRENVCSTQLSVGYEDDSRIVESLGFDKRPTDQISAGFNDCIPENVDVEPMTINEPKEHFSLYEDETFSVGDEPKPTFEAVIPEQATQSQGEVIDGMEFDIEPYDSQRQSAPEESSMNNNVTTVEDVTSQ